MTRAINQGGGIRKDGSPGRIQPAPLLYTQNFRWKKVTEFVAVSDCVFYYFILYNNPKLNNCFHFCKQINKLRTIFKKNYLN